MAASRLVRGIVLMAAVGLIGCEHAGPVGADDPAPTLETIQAEVFNASCAVSGCHRGSDAPLGLDLSAGNARDNLVNVPSAEMPDLLRVQPGAPNSSYLVWKIEGRPDIVGERMPRGRPPLSEEQIQLIREWIADGAPAE
jgi:hypothetical protein